MQPVAFFFFFPFLFHVAVVFSHFSIILQYRISPTGYVRSKRDGKKKKKKEKRISVVRKFKKE